MVLIKAMKEEAKGSKVVKEGGRHSKEDEKQE